MDLSPYWKTIIDTFRDGLLVVNPHGDIVAANPSAEQLTGYTSDELVGKSCRILNCTGCKQFGKGVGERWCKLFSIGATRDKKCTITNKDGRPVHIYKSATVLRDEKDNIIGAVETLTDLSDLVRQQQQIETLRKTFHLDDGYYGILGKSPIMLRLFELIENVAKSSAPVLILGESGTGKELVARAVHEASNRAEKPFIKVNCAALNENLLESELFGHTKGAFTGADQTRIGRFEAAHKGTIFLDEIGDIPLSTQVKLLRVLEEKEIERVGDHKPILVDVRIVTATNKKLEDLIEQGKFREDLFFRINVFPLQCPPLIERKEDIPLIVQNFIKQRSTQDNMNILGLTPEALEKLSAYHWPGNIRELRNIIEYALVLCPGEWIEAKHLPSHINTKFGSFSRNIISNDGNLSKQEELIRALQQTMGNQTKAGHLLGVSRITIWKRMKKYGIELSHIL